MLAMVVLFLMIYLLRFLRAPVFARELIRRAGPVKVLP